MLACRSLLRTSRFLQSRSAYLDSKQWSCSYHDLSYNMKKGGAVSELGAMDPHKKRKAVNSVWRPISSQASSIEEPIMKDAAMESGSGSLTQVVEGQSVVNVEKCSLSVEVGATVFRFIRGIEGATQKQIEEEMGVKIIFPSEKKEDSIVIEGSSADNVTKASQKIQSIIEKVAQTPMLDYSHFVSLPLAIHPELVDKLVNFQNTILKTSDANADESMEGNHSGENSENGVTKEKLDGQPNVAIGQKVEVNRRVKVDIGNIPILSYAPKASSSSKLPDFPSKRNFTNFPVKQNLTDLGIEKSIFIKPKTFHLTVLMLKLWNKERVNAATEVLKNISSKVLDALDNRPVSVRLEGLDLMRGSLAQAAVVYIPIEEIGSEGRLLRACQVITDAFVEAGLVMEKDATKEFKLHATVMNSRHRKRNRSNKFNKRKKVDSFDARDIFEQFGSENWGEYLISEAHLSQRFVFREDGYYHCCASIPFPENMQVE